MWQLVPQEWVLDPSRQAKLSTLPERKQNLVLSYPCTWQQSTTVPLTVVTSFLHTHERVTRYVVGAETYPSN